MIDENQEDGFPSDSPTIKATEIKSIKINLPVLIVMMLAL